MFEFRVHRKEISVNAIRDRDSEIPRFKGLHPCDLVRLSLFPPLPGGERERNRERERAGE